MKKGRSLSFYISKPLHPCNLLFSFGELTFNSNQESFLNTTITGFDKKENKAKAESFVVEPTNIGILSVFKRGDVFDENGKIQKKTDRNRRKKFVVSLSLDPKLKLEPISTILSPTIFEKYELLSREYHQQWAMRCQAFNRETQESVELVVPATAIAAFYLPHSCLLKAAMSGKGTNVLYHKKLSIETIKEFDNRINYVHLRAEMYDIVAPHVGRIFYSEYAKKRYCEIHQKSSHKKLPSGKLSLYCAPFVHGNLQWKVEAKPIADSNQLLVSSIEACSGAYPFKNLVFGRDNDNRGEAKEYEDGVVFKKKPVPNKKGSEHSISNGDDDTHQEQNQDKIKSSGATDSQIEITHMVFDESELIHQGLEGTTIRKIDKRELKHPGKKKIIVYVGTGEIDALSHGNSGVNTNNEKLGKLESGYRVTSESALKKSGSDNIEHSYSKTLNNYISAISNVEINNLTIKNRRLPVSIEESKHLGSKENIVPTKLRDLESPANWVMTDQKKPGEFDSQASPHYRIKQIKRCRKFLIFELKYKFAFAYILEFERLKKNDRFAGIIFSDGLKKLPRELEKELGTYVKSRQTWRKNSTMPYKQKFAHNRDIFDETDDKKRLKAMTDFYQDRIQKWISTLN
ncbi:hypothetical protein J7384_08770 [Endozoicomonas sp. G2_1]|uniref:hypothetical protein n=1 Tax=Endozoicomonas sp. G2_1 TaxID=2821091 RepID=UPI001AD9B0A1|nr:hypothetical protein [Endozoicomonas sp. G2_1]MBO9490453.1 hypothetical protein [Endozoicomonas sp. G2_1]